MTDRFAVQDGSPDVDGRMIVAGDYVEVVSEASAQRVGLRATARFVHIADDWIELRWNPTPGGGVNSWMVRGSHVRLVVEERMLAIDTNELDGLAARAWKHADEMNVLADYLLEHGEIVPLAEPSEHAHARGPRWDLECAVRDWILHRFYADALELRVTGGPDAVMFVVTTRGPSRARVKVFGSETHTPLLIP